MTHYTYKNIILVRQDIIIIIPICMNFSKNAHQKMQF
jgi:hypothetical protein